MIKEQICILLFETQFLILFHSNLNGSASAELFRFSMQREFFLIRSEGNCIICIIVEIYSYSSIFANRK